ncbi:melanopsin-A-like isoform X3 [Nerophis ophidion]|uniref:melanopsin-A-like isoform X3 n=1 Tax=Nerophis ophidion TaxID=159077 RepID=UPI002ADF8DD8|nr:melanopsin-A-like isoform X3 [Nerophis ophidion]
MWCEDGQDKTKRFGFFIFLQASFHFLCTLTKYFARQKKKKKKRAGKKRRRSRKMSGASPTFISCTAARHPHNCTPEHAHVRTAVGLVSDLYRPAAAHASHTAQAAMAPKSPLAFPTVDVPDHAHYTIGSVILVIGITGMLGNFLVIYAFSKSRSLRTPANMFIINLAVTDLLMCVTQSPIFFVSSMHKKWIFGEKACELYAFCGAVFGICSMITLTVIAVDRYFVITRPLTSIGVLSRKRALIILAAAWTYSLGWSLPPFFGWSAYVPEGLLTSCTWDYMTFTASVRAYTMLLFIFVFFLPLLVIIYCYVFIFRAIRSTNRAVGKMNGSVRSHASARDSAKTFQRLQNEWKMAKIALIVILLYVVSWSPYSAVALTAFAGYADMLTPYMNSVPAVIAKASAIHNPIIYAITHPKYRVALAKYIPCLGVLLCVRPHDMRSASSSFISTRRSTVTSQSSDISAQFRRRSKSRLSSVSDSESGLTDTEADLPSLGSRPASRQVSCDISRDTEDFTEFKPSSSFKSKMKSHDSGIFDKTSFDTDISTIGVGPIPNNADSAQGHVTRSALGRIPSIVITSESSPFLPVGRSSSRSVRGKATYSCTGAGSA